MSVTQFSFGTKPVSCHAYNKDESKVALSLNDEKVLIFARKGQKWEKEAELIEHSGISDFIIHTNFFTISYSIQVDSKFDVFSKISKLLKRAQIKYTGLLS